LYDAYKVQPGDTILIHAAAGGVGLIMCQWAKHLGATVIGTVSSDEKAAIAHTHGCDHPIVYTREDFAERVREITGGEGDENIARVLDPGRGRVKKGFFGASARDDRPWGGTDPPAVAYTYAPGRGAVHALKLLDRYRGIVQCDGYAAYKSIA